MEGDGGSCFAARNVGFFAKTKLWPTSRDLGPLQSMVNVDAPLGTATTAFRSENKSAPPQATFFSW